MIPGVVVFPLSRISDDRGVISHMLKKTDSHFQQFGEIYFSTIYPGAVKGWHRHDQATLNYACIVGAIKLVLYDGRDDSPARGELGEFFLGKHNYCLVRIPPGVWNGFMALGGETAVVANCCTHTHGDFSTERLDPFTDLIPYDWGLSSL